MKEGEGEGEKEGQRKRLEAPRGRGHLEEGAREKFTPGSEASGMLNHMAILDL